MLTPIRVINKCVSPTIPKEIDLVGSKTTVFVAKNITKIKTVIMGTEMDAYQYDLYYYDKAGYLAEMIDNSTTGTLDPIIDPETDIIDVITKKAKALGNRCTERIKAGFDLKLRDKTMHFSLSSFDQMNIDTQLNNILNLGMKKVAYHADNAYCDEFTAEEFIKIAATAKSLIMIENTYANYLITHLKNMKNIDAIMSLNYGDDLTEAEKKEYDKLVESQADQFITAIKDKTGIDITDIIIDIIENRFKDAIPIEDDTQKLEDTNNENVFDSAGDTSEKVEGNPDPEQTDEEITEE